MKCISVLTTAKHGNFRPISGWFFGIFGTISGEIRKTSIRSVLLVYSVFSGVPIPFGRPKLRIFCHESLRQLPRSSRKKRRFAHL